MPEITRRELVRCGLGVAAAALGRSASAAEAKTIPTVLGSIVAGDLGMTLPHEHPCCLWDFRRVPYPGPRPDELPQRYRNEQNHTLLAIWDLLGAELKRNGLRSILDPTPEYLGRAVGTLQEISRRTGLNIMCVTGYYTNSARPADFVARGVDAAKDYMVRELTDGIAGTSVRPAAIKLAVGGRLGNEADDLMLAAGGRAQKETGAPLTTHGVTPESRRHLLDMLEKNGADLSRVAIGHADTNGSAEESAELLRRAGYVLYTIWGITDPKLIGSGTPVAPDHSAKLIRSLLDRGLIDKVMFSIDSQFYLHQGGIGLCAYDIPERTSNFAFTFVLPQLRKLGISDGEIRRMMVDNPRRHLCGA